MYKKLVEIYNEDCISGCKKHIKENSIDLILTDPPYGIEGDKLHKHYHRNEQFVIDGYVEIPKQEYLTFSKKWIKEAERILKPGGSIYIVSGYTNLTDILIALKETTLIEKNHIVWKYNFGVNTTQKFVSSHYHILYYVKPDKKPTFNTQCRYSEKEKDDSNKSLLYKDLEDVWIINREYKPGVIKNKNQLPTELLIKIIQYSSNEGDVVCDLFAGSFSTLKTAIELNRKAIGFELNKQAFQIQQKNIEQIKAGYLLSKIRKPQEGKIKNKGKKWTAKDKTRIIELFKKYHKTHTKKQSIDLLSHEFERGYFSILNILKEFNL